MRQSEDHSATSYQKIGSSAVLQHFNCRVHGSSILRVSRLQRRFIPTPEFPFARFTSNLDVRWVLGHAMDDRMSTYVPAVPTRPECDGGPDAANHRSNIAALREICPEAHEPKLKRPLH